MHSWIRWMGWDPLHANGDLRHQHLAMGGPPASPLHPRDFANPTSKPQLRSKVLSLMDCAQLEYSRIFFWVNRKKNGIEIRLHEPCRHLAGTSSRSRKAGISVSCLTKPSLFPELSHELFSRFITQLTESTFSFDT